MEMMMLIIVVQGAVRTHGIAERCLELLYHDPLFSLIFIYSHDDDAVECIRSFVVREIVSCILLRSPGVSPGRPNVVKLNLKMTLKWQNSVKDLN